MDAMDLILVGIIVVGIVVWLVAKVKLKKSKQEAEAIFEEAKSLEEAGEDSNAIGKYRYALEIAVENPDVESKIVERLRTLYQKHNITHYLDDILKLSEDYKKILKIKSTNKMMKMAQENLKLKKDLILKLPHTI